jgi:DNA-binding transcriptional regulator/RsmH inhibitor MraZ
VYINQSLDRLEEQRKEISKRVDALEQTNIKNEALAEVLEKQKVKLEQDMNVKILIAGTIITLIGIGVDTILRYFMGV